MGKIYRREYEFLFFCITGFVENMVENVKNRVNTRRFSTKKLFFRFNSSCLVIQSV